MLSPDLRGLERLPARVWLLFPRYSPGIAQKPATLAPSLTIFVVATDGGQGFEKFAAQRAHTFCSLHASRMRCGACRGCTWLVQFAKCAHDASAVRRRHRTRIDVRQRRRHPLDGTRWTVRRSRGEA